MILHLCHHWFWITTLSVLLTMAVLVRAQEQDRDKTDAPPTPGPDLTPPSHPPPLPPRSKLKAVLFNVTRLYPIPDVPDRSVRPELTSPGPDDELSRVTEGVVGSAGSDPSLSTGLLDQREEIVRSAKSDLNQVSTDTPVDVRHGEISDDERHLSFDVSEVWPHPDSHDHPFADPGEHWDTLERVDRTLFSPEVIERRDIPSQLADGDKPVSGSSQSSPSDQSDEPFSTAASNEPPSSDSDRLPSSEQSVKPFSAFRDPSSTSESDRPIPESAHPLSRLPPSDQSSSASDSDHPAPAEPISSTVAVTSESPHLLTDGDSGAVNQSERLEREIRSNATQTQLETRPGVEPGSDGLSHQTSQQTPEVVRKISTTLAPAHLNDSHNDKDSNTEVLDDVKHGTGEGGYTIYVTPPSPHTSSPPDLTTQARPTPSAPVEVVKKSDVSKIRDKSVPEFKAKFSSKTKERTPLKPVIVVESTTSAVGTVTVSTTGSSVSTSPLPVVTRTNGTSRPADYEVMNDSPVALENVTELAVENTSLSADYEELNHTAPAPASANLSSARVSAHGRMLDVTPQAHAEDLSHAWGTHAGELDVALISGISFGALALVTLLGAVSFIMYRRYRWNKPQTLSDKCSNPDSSGYIDDSTLRENSEEMYSLDNDSFLNSLEAMTIQNYWTDHVKHTKL